MELESLLRNFLSLLTVLTLLTSSIGGVLVQFDDPDFWPESASHYSEAAAPVSMAASRNDGNPLPLCNHGCHIANDLLALNSFSALAIVPLSLRITRFLATPALSMLSETLFRPPR